jgi:hypothetical protein
VNARRGSSASTRSRWSLLEGLSHREMAAVPGTTENNVAVQSHEALP